MYPVHYETDHALERSRLTTFFRLLLYIPIGLWAGLYSIAAAVVVVIAWFAIVFTGRYPAGMYDFVAGGVRLTAKANAYLLLVTDRYPSFTPDADASYPVRVDIGPPKERYSRAKAFFRIILAIPVLVILYALNIVAQVCAVAAWFVILVTGSLPKGLQDAIDLGLGYGIRAQGYLALLTEEWPPLTDEHRRLGPGAPAGGYLPPTGV